MVCDIELIMPDEVVWLRVEHCVRRSMCGVSVWLEVMMMVKRWCWSVEVSEDYFKKA